MRNERTAPKFTKDEPRSLPRYFEDLEEYFVIAGVTDEQEKKKYAIKYVEVDVAEDWEQLPSYTAPETYADFKKSVLALYPGAGDVRKYTNADATLHVEKWAKQGVKTLGDWAEFIRYYRTVSTWLCSQQKMSLSEQSKLAALVISTLPSQIRADVRSYLLVKQPDVHPDDGYSLASIDAAVRHQLHGTSSSVSPTPVTPTVTPVIISPVNQPHTFIPSGFTPVKNEEIAQMRAMMQKLTADQSSGPTMAQPRRLAPDGSRQAAIECLYCGLAGHMVRACPDANADINTGHCIRDVYNRIALPSGAYVPGSIKGATLRARIWKWHELNPGQLASAAGNAAIAATNMYTIAEGYANDPSTVITAEDLEVLQRLSAAFLQAAEPSDRFAGTDLPRNLRSAQRVQATRAQGVAYVGQPPPLPSTQKEMAAIPEQSKIEGSKKAVAKEKGKAAESVPALPVDAPSASDNTAEHPFAKARSQAEYTAPNAKNVGAPAAKPTKEAPAAAYRSVAPIEDVEACGPVMEKMLDASVEVTLRSLMQISPEIRNRLKQKLTARRVPTPESSATEQYVFLEDVTDEQGIAESASYGATVYEPVGYPPNSIVFGSTYEAYLAGLDESDDRKLLVVASDNHAIRSMNCNINDREPVECLLDPGSQIVSMSEAYAGRLRLSWDPSIVVRMQSANGQVEDSLGLARSVPFEIGNITIYLQVHILRNAAYDVLCGRPIDVLTASVVRNKTTGEQTITMTCPNTGDTVTVPTQERSKPRYRPRPQQDFQMSRR